MDILDLVESGAATKLNPVAVLEEAHELISKEHQWTQDHYALDEEGEECDVFHPRACTYCAMGAILYAMNIDPEPDSGTFFSRLWQLPAYRGVYDCLKHAAQEILTLVKCYELGVNFHAVWDYNIGVMKSNAVFIVNDVKGMDHNTMMEIFARAQELSRNRGDHNVEAGS